MAATPAIAFDIRIGHMVRDGLLTEVDIDYDALDATLTELGEPEEPDTELSIIFGRFVKPGDSAGRTYFGRDGRIIVMPIMTEAVLTPTTHGYTGSYVYDAQAQNTTLLHELQHAVDFTDQDIRGRNKQETQKARLIAGMGRIGCYALAVANTLVAANDYLQATNNVDHILDGVAIGTVGLATYCTKKWIDGQQYHHFSHKRIMERRAYSTEALWLAQNRIPSILKVYRMPN